MAALLWLAAGLAQNTPPTQPIPFSHKQHADIKLKCGDCHTTPDPGEVVTIPPAAKCMICHQTIKADSAAIENLKRYAGAKQEVPWARVYQIPGYVYFSHKVHTEAGAQCERCHGPVAERERLGKETDLSMGGCMGCHRERKATLDCAGCHEART